MSESVQSGTGGPWLQSLFRGIKYLTFLALSLNVYLFLQQELGAANVSTAASFGVGDLIQLFSATLDTAAWLVLLLLFELETAVLPDDKLVGTTRLAIHSMRLFCGVAIVSAFFGYLGEWHVFLAATSIPAEPCALVNDGWTVLLAFDEFAPLDATQCIHLGRDALSITALDRVVAAPQIFTDAHHLALVDAINAGAWILVVIVLEVEVRLQLQGGVPKQFQWVLNSAKLLIYLTLAAAAVFWGFEGDFLDFWDAALWLFAFVFIELNVFEWQRELDNKAEL